MPKDWKDGPGGETPILAAELESMEELLRRGVNVKDYGAKGDGETDDTAAIQAAQDAAAAVEGTVYFPPSTYVTKRILYDSGVSFLGAGMGTVVRCANDFYYGGGYSDGIFVPRLGETAAVFTDRCYFGHMKLLGNSAGQWEGGPTTNATKTLHGIRMVGARHCISEYIWAEDFDGDGIYMGATVAGVTEGAFYCTVRDCVMTKNIRNGGMIGTGLYNRWVNNQFVKNQQGMEPESPKFKESMYASAEFDMEPNNLTEECSHNLVRGNLFLNGVNKGIQITRPSASSSGTKYNRIVDNQFVDCADVQLIVTTDVGIGNVIRDNTFICSSKANMDHHLRIARGHNNQVDDNVFLGSTAERPVLFDSSGEEENPTGNTFRRNICVFAEGGDSGAVFIEQTCRESRVADNTMLEEAHLEHRSASEGGPIIGERQFVSTWLADNAQTQQLGTLPAGAFVTGVQVQVTEAFDSSGGDVIEVGYAADKDAFAKAVDVSTTGIKTVEPGVLMGFNGTGRTMVAYYQATGEGASAPTKGKAIVVVEFTFTEAEIP